MKKNKRALGFSLSELIIVIIILGILAGISIPAYRKFLDASEDKQARAVLQTIWAGQKVYYQKNGYYYPPPPATYATDINSINAGLRLNLLPDRDASHPDKPWDYEIWKFANVFLIRAIHISGREIRIDQNGNFTET